VRKESSAAPRQAAWHPTPSPQAEEPQCVDGAGIVYGLCLSVALWLIGLVIVLLIW
jgi:hypothetical protein